MKHHYETNDAWHDKRRVAGGGGNKEQVTAKLRRIATGWQDRKRTPFTQMFFLAHYFDMHGRISAMSRWSFRRIGNSEREWGWIMDDTANTSETTTITVRDFLPNKLNLSPFWRLADQPPTVRRKSGRGAGRGGGAGGDSGLDPTQYKVHSSVWRKNYTLSSSSSL